MMWQTQTTIVSAFTVRQLVSNIKVLDKDSLLICFKDGTEITQAMQRRQTA